jgi:glycosyltransferase involved in cell wall biosynthesis
LRKVILATDIGSVSYRLQMGLIERLFKQYGFTTTYVQEYFSRKRRDFDQDIFIMTTPISENLRFWMQIFLGYEGRKILYLGAWGKPDMTYYQPTIFQLYRVYANSMRTLKLLAAAGMKVDGVVHHGLDMDAVAWARENPASLPISRDDGKTVFCYTANIDYRKRPDLILEAFRKAQKKTDYRIALVTVSRISKLLRQDDRDIYELGQFGKLPYEQVLSIISASDYYLHLTTCESFGLPALESRALGRPIVALDGEPTTEFIPRGGAFWVPIQGTTPEMEMGFGAYILYIYDTDEAADMIAQAHDIRVNYPSQYEDMRQRMLEGVEEYDYRVKYKEFLY